MNAPVLVVGGLFLLSLLVSKVRGVRNNNWLNIKHRIDNAWHGMLGVDAKNYVIFMDPIWSLRAGFRILSSYQKRGIDTIEKIITEFAPPKENDTKRYIATMALLTGINPKTVLTPAEWLPLIKAMVKMEVGKDVSDGEVYRAYSLAFS